MSELTEDGRIVKGVNTTVDVGTDEIKKQAAKFGNTVDKDGKPPTLSKKVKGKSTNVLFNLGLTEGIKLRLERDKNIDVLHIMDTSDKQRIEVRGKKGYETGGYDAKDKLHQVLDRVGKAANISDLMNGEVVGINPDHPQGVRAIRTARDVLQTEEKRFTAMEQACIEGGHDISDLYEKEPVPKVAGNLFTQLENFADGKKKVQEAFDNPYPIKWLSLRPDSSSSAKAKLDDGSELEIHFADDDAGYYDIEFLRSGSMKVSGEGDEFRVFATVQAAILEWWEQADKKYVRAISFSADKGDNNRSKLYKRFAEMWAKKIKWQFKSDDGRRDVEFSLIRPKAVEENFADGKVKGKSRPGRVKRSGASCNGSVTELRAKAKKASGEKAKMYHWCANMKAGKKK